MPNPLRKYLLLALSQLLSLSLMGQRPAVELPANGDWPTVVGDSIMLIGPKQEALTEEQRYFNPVYLMVYPGKEHLKEQMIRAALCDCDPTKPNRRIGVFSVAPDKQVSFSQGNLQYLPAANIWKFADTQYEYLGNANKYLTPTFRNWVDLFGWSANNTTAPFGVSTSTNAADYSGEFVDWGTNTICGEAPGTWRTLSADEWEYLLKKRKNASDLYGVAQVAGVNGMIILPDVWEEANGIVFKSGLHSSQVDDYSVYQSFTDAQWLAMENAGAVFLPALGYRDGTNVEKCDTSGYYWSNTTSDEKSAYRLYFYSYFLAPNDVHGKYRGRSVRLVHDTIVPETIPEPCLVVKVNDTLSINMMCVEGGTFTMGDGANAHPVSLSSYSIGQTEVTQALWEAVMGTNPSANTANKQLPVTNISWYDCQEFINRLNQLTSLHFRLPTEAEWEYASRGGQRSKGYAYAGSNDINEVAWYNGNSGNTLHAVAQKKPNELGIYDMSGNAWEWCHDWHAPYPTTHLYNPLGPEVGQMVGTRYLRVFRGGSYGYEAAYHQNVFRDITGPEPDKGTANLGLRLVLSDEVNFQTIHVNDTLSFHMMDVKGGTFTMGDDNTSNASPPHQVTLSDYYIGQTEVTQALWKSVMGNIPTGNKNPSYPVGYVTYADCQNFIAKLNNLTGLHFQLPTEAEWEYAAMGGNKSHNYIYSGSNTIDDVAWYDQNSENKLHHVGAKQPNELGIYDMSGNAWEWCADYYDKYTADPKTDPKGPTTGTGRVIRSGSFRTTAERCSNKHRQAREADYPDSHITLRLVLHDTEPAPEPEYVDLGLSVKWATFNVGATSPEDYGDYFAWGETEPKETYSWATYKWGTSSKLTKYNTTDGKTILEPEDDAAQVHWGGKWRMPSKEEVDELTQQCTWIWTTHNNVNGYKVTGPNGNSIFLPAAGYKGAGPTYPAGEDGLYWTNTIEQKNYSYLIVLHDDAPPTHAGTQGTRCYGFAVRAVYDDRPTLTVIPTPEDAKVTFLCKGYQAVGHSITVDKGKDVLYQVTNVDAGYLSQGDSIYKLTKDSVLYVTLRPFSDGNWVKVDKSELTKQEGYYVSRNYGGFASHSVWNYYVLPVLPGETYRVRGIAGQHAALWMAASTAPDAATNTRPTKISCCANRGVAAYVADEVTIPDGAKYLIINSRNGQEMMVERKVPDPCLAVKVNDTLSINLMCVEGGTFMMGSEDAGAEADEQPVHEVSLSDYYIGQNEVTQYLWKKVMGDENNPSATKGNNLPVTNITWDEAQTFVERLSELTGMRFRLPTEAKWEYAARGGQRSKGYTYAGSNDIDEVGWYNGNSSNKTHAVGQKQPNELGIYDMTGNVWEYCYDWHTPYAAQAQTNPTGAVTGEKHVLRGGCYHYDSKNCTNTNRHSYYTPDKGGASTGLRIVLEPQRYYRYGFTQEDWDAATATWGHGGRGHAPADQSCIQGTMVHGIRLKVAKVGSLNVYKVPSLLEKNEDNFEFVATLTTDSTGVQDFDFAEPIYIAPNEYLVFGKPSEEEPTLRPCYMNISRDELPIKAKGFAHYIGTEKAKVGVPNGSLMVEFY